MRSTQSYLYLQDGQSGGVARLHAFAVSCSMFFLLTAVAACLTAMVSMASAQEHSMEKDEQGSRVLLTTTVGAIEIELHANLAPETVANFLQYVEDDFYDGLVFHRVMPGFVIQGGGFGKNLILRQTRSPITNEASNELPNIRGSLSMARTNDPHSATSQFFVNLTHNSFLDYSESPPGYAVFGQVIVGMDVVDKIAQAPTTTKNGMQNVPATDVVILSARLITHQDGMHQDGM